MTVHNNDILLFIISLQWRTLEQDHCCLTVKWSLSVGPLAPFMSWKQKSVSFLPLKTVDKLQTELTSPGYRELLAYLRVVHSCPWGFSSWPITHLNTLKRYYTNRVHVISWTYCSIIFQAWLYWNHRNSNAKKNWIDIYEKIDFNIDSHLQNLLFVYRAEEQWLVTLVDRAS